MEGFSYTSWVLSSVGLVGAISFREPSLESVGAKIQSSICGESDYEASFDICVFVLTLVFMALTVNAYTCYK
jgi:hypothetical protein